MLHSFDQDLNTMALSDLACESVEHDAMLEVLVDSLDEGVAMVDGAGVLRHWNHTLSILFGFDGRRLVGRRIADFRDELAGIAAPTESGGPTFDEALRRLPEPTTMSLWINGRALEVLIAPVRNHPRSFVTVVRDVTARRELERAKDELIAHVSHELRNPMSAVLGFCELLLERELSPAKQRSYLEYIRTSAARLTELLNDFLDIQRLEAGRTEFDITPTPLEEVVQGIVAAYTERNPTVTFGVDIQPWLPPVLADRTKLVQILENLIGNAVKYSPGGGRIQIEATVLYGLVTVTVTDHGLGLPANAISRLFAKFYRVVEPERRDIAGTGLGLAITRKLVEAHGGRVWASSPGPGRGSTFGFTMPAAESSGLLSEAPRVLVVEDDPEFASLLMAHLESQGYAVHREARSDHVLERVRKLRPAAILLDIMLPGPVDGWDLLPQLKAQPESASIPVIVVSVQEDRRRGLVLGADEFLTKPLDPGLLIRRTMELLAPQQRRVLVADDDPDLRESVRVLLTDLGFEVGLAADGVEALAEIERKPPDLLLMDLTMPEFDGFELLRRLPTAGHMKIVVMTGRILTKREHSWLSERIDGLVEKQPRETDEILRSILKVLHSVVPSRGYANVRITQ